MTASPQRILDAHLRNDLVAFTQKVFTELNPGRQFEPNWHHEAMAYLLDVVVGSQPVDRLLINVPPRSLKSVMITVALPAFLLGRDPTKKIITVCYNQDLANDFSRKCRQVMRSAWYRRLFPSTQIVGQGAEAAFYTTAGGFRMATSVEGTLTGRGGDLIIIDDPQKAAEAPSESRRESVHRWMTETLFTRLDDKREGGIILVQQRLHEDDLSGRFLKSGGWLKLIVPVEATEDKIICLRGGSNPSFHHRAKGDLLDPIREPREVLDTLKRDMGSATYAAQYQQDPLPPDGDIIKVAWFRTWRELPKDGRTILSIDTASKPGPRNDWSVISTWLVADGRYYLTGIWRRRVEYPELKAAVIEHAQRLDPDTILVEDKGTGIGLIQDLRGGSIGYPVVAHDPGGADKQSRMKVQSAKIEGGLVFLPEHAPWLQEFLDEVRRFPNGAHDDQIDAMSQLLDYASNHRPGNLFIIR